LSVVFFTDRDLGLTFPAILRSAGLRVERHADHFAPDCPDEMWLRDVANRGWIAVTHDGRINPGAHFDWRPIALSCRLSAVSCQIWLKAESRELKATSNPRQFKWIAV
jgi:hypothetical protein